MVEDIRFEDFHVEFPGKDGTATVANHISVTFEKGKITGLIGESGRREIYSWDVHSKIASWKCKGTWALLLW